jgi:hypothetical protein
MKRLFPVLCSLVFALGSLHGQYGAPKDDTDEKQPAQPPEEIPDFNNLDEYVYQPKSTLNYGTRFNFGPKVAFGGHGVVTAQQEIPSEGVTDTTTPNIFRIYHDGAVDPDGRTLTIGTGSGSGSIPVAPDGKTDVWTYIDPSQLTSDGYMQFHLYSAVVPTIDPVEQDGKNNIGAEIYTAVDMGRLGKHLKWNLFGGVSISDISAASYMNENAVMSTVTDTYNLFGVTPPAVVVNGAPYTSPTSTQETIAQSGGGTETITIANETLISNTPLNRATTASDTFVTDHFKTSGAFFTLRFGPQLEYDFNDHLKFTVNAGPALIYAGTNYTTTQVLQPPTGIEFGDIVSDGVSVFRLAGYMDASLEYDITDTTGFYIGAFYEGARSYDQHIYDGQGSDYSSKVDLSDQQGLRTGMTYRF